jgi:pantoate--beta-alanine ligase
MHIVNTITAVRQAVRAARTAGKTVGLVPTMGALHRGHTSLIRAAVQQCNYVVVSIFVNPTQFGPQEDLNAYPRPFEEDCELCCQAGVNLVFSPNPDEMYGGPSLTWITVDKLTESLCGRSREGHFRGVTTVCAKLFNIVLPDQAFFGQKDAQQAAVIKRMVDDLNIPLTIEVCPTIREPDGLAISSRNDYLNDVERKQAICLFESLQMCKRQIEQGLRSSTELIALVRKRLDRVPNAVVDYIEIVDNRTFVPVDTAKGTVLIALAVQIGPARLIDNIVIDCG